MVYFYNSFSPSVAVDDASADAEQVDEYASSFIESVAYGWCQTLKKVMTQVDNALLNLSCLKAKGKNKWAVDGVVKALKAAKVFGGVA